MTTTAPAGADRTSHTSNPTGSAAAGTVRRPPGALVATVFAVLLLAAIIAGVGIGPLSLPPDEVLRILFAQMTNGSLGGVDPSSAHVVWELRLPRGAQAAR